MLRFIFSRRLITGLSVLTALGGASPEISTQQDEARPLVPQSKPSQALKEDVRPRVRELLQEALDVLLTARSGISQPRGILECAVLQARAGDAESARKTFQQAKQIIQTLPQQNQPEEWRSLARSLAQAGELEEVRAVIAVLPDPGQNYGGTPEAFRNIVLSECASVLAKAGKSKEALELSKQSDAASRFATPPSRLFHFVALYHAKRGDLNEARRAVDQITDPIQKLGTLAGMIYGSGVAPQTRDLPSEPGIALIQDETGDHNGARRNLKLALEIAGSIKEPRVKTRGFAIIACAQARIGDIAGARKTLEQIPAESNLNELAQVAIAKAQAAAGHGKEALQAVEKLSTMSLRVYGLSQVAIGQASAKDLEAARDTGKKAFELIENLPEGEHLGALRLLSEARALARDFEGARETASRITFNNHVFAYASIAYIQAQSGDVKGALGTVEDNMKGWWHDRTLQSIALVQAERGEEKAALAWTRELTKPEPRGYTLLGVAEGMLEKHHIGLGKR
jgi:tetratricopeptide (TPR) repeat protein